jgi:photosystem II stability/assembly factor-like uncharacterized protein
MRNALTFVSCSGFSFFLSLAAIAQPAVAAPQDEKSKPELGAIEFRSIGPAVPGRTTRASGVKGQPLVYYAAFAQGGVWKSVNGGRDWKPVFDDQPTQSIGSLAVAPSDPSVVYVGSGEANIRGNVALGSGIFRSTDAGRSWEHVWKSRGQIGTMEVHPHNADIAFAAVLGSPFGANAERGVYRTTDGGKNWQRVLHKDDVTGACDVAIDPSNPRIVFAGLWQTRREPWKLTSGGPGSGLYRSTDGGDTWTQLSGKGLPSGGWGKIGVRVAPSKPEVVYALIEAEQGGLFRSDDGGATWQLVNAARVLRQRAWYYTVLTIDPVNADVVWFPQVNMLRTVDGGRTIHSVELDIHGDHHDLWLDPLDSRRMIAANDGGVGVSIDGVSWYAPPMPTGQFYNIDADDRVPYHVGGTMQDWGTASGPAYTLRSGGPNLGDFDVVGGGEAGDFVYDAAAPGHVYAGEYSGHLSHYQERTGNYRNITIYPRNFSGTPSEKARYRFQWTAPIADSPHDPRLLYHGANVLFRSGDRGATWTAISPDLTRNDRTKQQWSGGPITGDITGVEVYGTIFSVAESPLAAGEIWAGTDDGLVQLTRDGGKNWSNVTPKELPEWGTVECVEPSRRAAGTAYVVVDARRLNDTRPYLFRTRDYGQSWERLANGLPDDQHLFVVREDPTDPRLLYVGAERGLFFSRDGGASFIDLRGNLPAVGVADIEVRHDDLILGTRRGIWVLDDLTSLRALTPEVKATAATLFAPRAVPRFRLDSRWDEGAPGEAPNRPYGLIIDYWLKDAAPELAPGAARSAEDPAELSLEILDARGQLVRTLSSVPRPNRYAKDDPDQPQEPNEGELTRKQGLNRAVWDLRYEGSNRVLAKFDAGNPDRGPLVLPGKYTLRLRAGGEIHTTTADVLPDPRSPVTAAELEQNVAFALEARAALDRLADGIEEVRAIRTQASDFATRLALDPNATAAVDAAHALIARCEELESRMHNPEAEVVYDVLAGRSGGAKLYAQIAPLIDSVQAADYAPSQGLRDQLAENLAELKAIETELAAMRAGELARLEAAASALPRVILPPRAKGS